METYFFQECTSHAWGEASLPQGALFVVLNHVYRLQNFDRLSISPLPATIVCSCLNKNTVWLHHNTSAGDFISRVFSYEHFLVH